ncbi:hypothetical protein BJX61DRAFT_382516 [Aspergillus egyptiacus]|nr:hypothetical protein BJX61DRAFT_382516 [Aspergillus egyptiacus]
MKIIIIGAGLGGLACAISCLRAESGLSVLVLERAPDGGEIGAGIQIPPNGAKILERLGLLDKILDRGQTVQQVEFRRYEDGRLLRGMPMGEQVVREFGVPWVIIHRQDFYQVLLEEAGRVGAEIRFGAEVTDVLFGLAGDGPEVLLAGGERVQGDVVIGADGLYSRTRDIVLEAPTRPQETGDLAYRATFKKDQLDALDDPKVNELCIKTAITSWLGPDKHTIFYPVRGGEEFNLVLLRPDNLEQGTRRAQADVEEMRESYAGWDETLQKLISCVPAVTKWKLSHLPELQTWTRGPVALLGDACHPTLPYQAQGAAMAVEDGFALGKLLGLLKQHKHLQDTQNTAEPTLLSPDSLRAQRQIADVLTLYEAIRRARTTRNVQTAARNRRVFHIPDGMLQMARDFLLGFMGVTKSADWTVLFSARMRYMLDHDLEGECERAFEKYRVSIGCS